MADLIIQPLDGLNNGTFDDLTASNIECDNLRVLQDLTVEGNQIFTGNQTVDGNVSIGGFLGVTGPVVFHDTLEVSENTVLGGNFNQVEETIQLSGETRMRGPLKVYDDMLTDNLVRCHQGLESATNLDTGSGEAVYITTLIPSGTPTISGSWSYFISPSTYPSVLTGYDFELRLATGWTIGQNRRDIPPSVSCLVEMEVNSVILPDTRTVYIPRDDTIRIRLPTAPFQGGLFDMFVYLNTASSGTNWGSAVMELYYVPKPDLRVTSLNGQVQYLAGPTGHHFFADGVSVLNMSSTTTSISQPLTSSSSITAASFSGNGAALTSLNAGNVTSGLLAVARGGTNAGILNANKLMVGNGTSGVLTPNALHWNNLDTRLGINTVAPNSTLDVNGIAQMTRLGLGHTTVAPTNRLEVRNINAFGVGGIIADFQTGGGTTRLQIVDETTTGSLPASIKNVGGANGIGVWPTAGPVRLLSGPTGTTRATFNQDGTWSVPGTGSIGPLTVTGNTNVSGSLVVGGSTINGPWVRSFFTAGTNTTYDSGVGSFSISDSTIRSRLSAGSGISYDSTTGVITNSLPTQWQPFSATGATGIFYNQGRVGVGTSTPQHPLSTVVNLEGGFDPSIALNIENTWNTNSNVNVYARFKTAFPTASEWLMGVDESQNFDLYNTGFNEVYGFAANGTLTVPERLWVGDPAYRPSTRPFEVGYLATSAVSVGAHFNNHFNGSNNFIQVSNRNTTNPAFQNSAFFGVSSTGDVEILEEGSTQLLTFNTAGMATFRDDVTIRANPGVWDTTTDVPALHFRYSTNGTHDQAYIQSVIRSTSTLKRLVIQGSETWIGSDYDATSIAASRGRVNIFGPSSTAGSGGGHMNFFTNASDYPTMSLFNFTNNNEGILFDAYYDGLWRSSSNTGNYAILKQSNQLQFLYSGATTAGSAVTWQQAFHIPTNGNVQFLCNAVGMTGTITVAGNATFNQNLYGEAVQCNWNTGRTIAGAVSRLTSSAPVATEWIGAFNATDTTTGARGVIFTRAGVIIGAVRYDAGAVAYLTTSDYRIKKNIRPYGCGLGIIRRLKPCKYEMVEDGSFGEGFIAHELQEVLPHAVSGKKDALNEDGTPDHQSIDKMAVIAPLVVATQQLDNRLTQLNTKVEVLGGVDVSNLIEENTLLKDRVSVLEKQLSDLITLLKRKYII